MENEVLKPDLRILTYKLIEEMNRILLPSGLRENYKALDRELFWDTKEQSLYLRNKNRWILMAGKWKNWPVVAGDNLEIIFPVKDDVRHQYPMIRLKDNIVLHSMELGKFSTIPHWKGFIKLGEVENTSFFPVLKFSKDSHEIVAGKFWVKTRRIDGTDEYGIYHASMCSDGKCSIYGSDSRNIKDTINYEKFEDGTEEIGFRTFSTLEKVITYETIENAPYQHTREIFFTLYSRDDIRFESSEGSSVAFTRLTEIYDTGNDPLDGRYCWWYELSMADFRRITGIPRVTGLSLDQFDDNSFVYFDIFINAAENAFSIDRAFITTRKATTEDEIVSEGRIWCHNPYWMTPNDKHTIDVGDSFKFISNVFDDSSDNLSFSPGTRIKIMDVYANVIGGTVTIAHEHVVLSPPTKVEIWYNGWDTRAEENKPSLENRSEDFAESLVLARN